MIVHFMASLLLVAGLGQASQAPAGWDALVRRGQQLILDHKTAEAIAVFDKGVKDHPAFDGAHYELAEAHKMLAFELAMTGAAQDRERLRHLDIAVTHYERAGALAGQYEPLAWGHLLQLYGDDELNRPADRVRVARHYIRLRPASAVGHVSLARALRTLGQESAAITALLDARKAVGSDDAQVLAATAVDFVLSMSALEAAKAKALLDYADPVLDRAVAADPEDRRALLTKAAALKARADKLERDPARRAALTKEADRVFERFRSTNPPPAPEPPPPPPAPDAATAKYTTAVTLFDQARRDKAMPRAEARKLLEDARRALDEALKLKPEYMEAIVYKSLVLRRLAEFESDPAVAKALLGEADRLRAQATEIMKKKSGGN